MKKEGRLWETTTMQSTLTQVPQRKPSASVAPAEHAAA